MHLFAADLDARPDSPGRHTPPPPGAVSRLTPSPVRGDWLAAHLRRLPSRAPALPWGAPAAGDRWRWRPGESLGEWLARTAGRRVRRCPSRYPFVRRVGRGWQARPWVAAPWFPTGRSVNLGYYPDSEHGADAEWAAGRASRLFVEVLDPPKGSRYVGWLDARGLRPGPAAVAAAVRELQARGVIPLGVRPPADGAVRAA